MTDLLNEFDEKRYPYRYRMNVGGLGVDRTRRWLQQAIDRLHLDAALVSRRISVHPDPEIRGSTDIGLGLANEGDYALLIAEFDRLSLEDYDAEMTARAEWEARVAEMSNQRPELSEGEIELLLCYEEQIAEEKARAERGNERDEIGLEL